MTITELQQALREFLKNSPSKTGWKARSRAREIMSAEDLVVESDADFWLTSAFIIVFTADAIHLRGWDELSFGVTVTGEGARENFKPLCALLNLTRAQQDTVHATPAPVADPAQLSLVA